LEFYVFFFVVFNGYVRYLKHRFIETKGEGGGKVGNHCAIVGIQQYKSSGTSSLGRSPV